MNLPGSWQDNRYIGLLWLAPILGSAGKTVNFPRPYMNFHAKSLEGRRTRIYYFVDDRCKDEISHFYSFNKNGLDGIAVFYKGENKVERIRYYEKDEEIWSKVEPEK